MQDNATIMKQETLKQYLQQKRKDVLNNLHRIDCTSKERNVVEFRYGIKDGVYRTLEETGKEFGVTRERIRQIEAKVEEKVRQILK